jgi:2-polyprenyl-3-methyl-5-hydroxy-6-metoxy-1,4-benzoquinol methylase
MSFPVPVRSLFSDGVPLLESLAFKDVFQQRTFNLHSMVPPQTCAGMPTFDASVDHLGHLEVSDTAGVADAYLQGHRQVGIQVVSRHHNWEALKASLTVKARRRGGLYQQLPHPDLYEIRSAFNLKRVEMLLPYLEAIPKGTVIDAGCNYGTLCHGLEDEGFQCLGIELDDYCYGVAVRLRDALRRKFNLWQGDMTMLRGLRTDILLAFNVFNHLANHDIEAFKAMVSSMSVKHIFFSTHEKVPGAEFETPHDFAQWIADATGLTQVELVGSDEECRVGATKPRRVFYIH